MRRGLVTAGGRISLCLYLRLRTHVPFKTVLVHVTIQPHVICVM